MIIGPIRLMPALTETYNLSCKESCVLHTRDPHLRPDLGEAVPPSKGTLSYCYIQWFPLWNMYAEKNLGLMQ